MAKLFDGGLGKGMHKATHPSGGVVHQIHTAGGASYSATMVMVFARLFVLFCAVSQFMTPQSGSLYVKNVRQHNLKMRLMVLLFVQYWHAPYHFL